MFHWLFLFFCYHIQNISNESAFIVIEFTPILIRVFSFSRSAMEFLVTLLPNSHIYIYHISVIYLPLLWHLFRKLPMKTTSISNQTKRKETYQITEKTFISLPFFSVSHFAHFHLGWKYVIEIHDNKCVRLSLWNTFQ